VSLVIAQRLARRICEGCRVEERHTKSARALLNETYPDVELPEISFRGAGCSACAGTGFTGRIGIFEVLAIDSAMREALSGGVTREKLERFAKGRSMRTLRMDALAKVEAGVLTLAEALARTTE
jgi:type IV pilus assembly protein PilB